MTNCATSLHWVQAISVQNSHCGGGADKPKEKSMKNKAFTAGVAVMAIGAIAMDSSGIGGIVAAIMVITGAMIAFAAYTSARLEKERQETEHRIQQLKKAS